MSKPNLIDLLRDMLGDWKAQEKEWSNTLQIGRCGDDDGSFTHGRYDMLGDCIVDVEYILENLEKDEDEILHIYGTKES